jgi:sterol-4alpha-carboxylate 3-dehydrogenase (decarboxylating)
MATISTLESYLVIGGCGFLGKTIVNMLLERGESEVAVFDIVQRDLDSRVRFFSGDLCDRTVMDDAINKVSYSQMPYF